MRHARPRQHHQVDSLASVAGPERRTQKGAMMPPRFLAAHRGAPRALSRHLQSGGSWFRTSRYLPVAVARAWIQL
jgi:hypothetical protein